MQAYSNFLTLNMMFICHLTLETVQETIILYRRCAMQVYTHKHNLTLQQEEQRYIFSCQIWLFCNKRVTSQQQ